MKNCTVNKLNTMATVSAAVLALVLIFASGTASAAVSVLDSWTNSLSTTGRSPQSFTYSAGTGTNRLMVVAITTKYGSTGTRSYSATYGGKPLTLMAQYNTGRENTWVGYLKEADIASRTGNTVTVTYSGSPSNTKVSVASYQNVDQTTPITDSSANGSNTNSTSITFGKNVTNADGGRLFYVAHNGSSTAAHTPPSGYSELLEHTGNGFSISVGQRNSTAAWSENQTVTFSSSSRDSIVVGSLNQASSTSNCTANAPTVSITPVSQVITQTSGSTTYMVNVKNNDSGSGCTSVSFSLTAVDSDAGGNFIVPSVLSTASLTLAPGANGNSTLTIRAMTGSSSGTNTTSVGAAASGHSTATSNSVTTTLNVPASGPEPTGWYAGDPHVHRSCGGTPEAISSMYAKMTSQNLAVLPLLADMGNGEVLDPATDLPRVNGTDDPVSTAGRLVHWEAEWHWDATYNQYAHQALGGHVVSLGLSEAHQIWEEYTYPIFQWAHQQNAIAGFVHMQYLDGNFPQALTCCTPVEYPVEVALGSADFISEDISGSDYAVQAYYRLLNTGFRPGFTAGTDYPCNGGAAPGSLLTYVQVAGGSFTYRNWIDGIAKGRTVVSRNGHNEFLNLLVNSAAAPGDEIKLTAAGSVPVTVTWTANESLSGTIELVQNGVVVASKSTSVSQSAPATLTATVDFTKSGWLAARRMDGSQGHMVQTGAVFVTVNNAPIRVSASDADFYVQWMDNLLARTSAGGEWNSYFPTSLSQAQARYQAAKAVFQQIALEAGGQSSAPAITTVSLPDGALNVSYSATMTATGGTTPYSWSLAGGALPAGLSLNPATGVISGTPTSSGTFPVTVQVTDAAAATASKALSITVSSASDHTIWPNTAIPANAAVSDGVPLTVGVKFRADVNGYITGLRFYKGSADTGTHVGSLWTRTGTLLATATFSGESSSGWQQVLFSSPGSNHGEYDLCGLLLFHLRLLRAERELSSPPLSTTLRSTRSQTARTEATAFITTATGSRRRPGARTTTGLMSCSPQPSRLRRLCRRSPYHLRVRPLQREQRSSLPPQAPTPTAARRS